MFDTEENRTPLQLLRHMCTLTGDTVSDELS